MTTQRFFGRSLARSQALQLLFQAELTGRSLPEVLSGPYALAQADPLEEPAGLDDAAGLDSGLYTDVLEEPIDEYGERLALGVDAMREELDAVIGWVSTNWAVGRMPVVDRNLLRLALYEMLEVDEVAVAVAIDECVELAKAYGTDESSRFMNGLLGRVAQELEDGVDVIGLAKRRTDGGA